MFVEQPVRHARILGRRPKLSIGLGLGASAATVLAARDGLAITLDRPARGVAPGQAAVLYDDDQVLGAARVND